MDTTTCRALFRRIELLICSSFDTVSKRIRDELRLGVNIRRDVCFAVSF